MYSAQSTLPRWQNPEVFAVYRAGRSTTGGVAERQIAEVVMGYIHPDVHEVLEVGAGDGALVNMVGEHLPDSVNWLETDQSKTYLTIPRTYRTKQQVVEFPNTSFEDESFDAVVSLAAFDTFPERGLGDSLQECQRILRIGGMVVHVLDMSANTDTIYQDAAEHGLLPFPGIVRRKGAEQVSGIYFVKKDQLAKSLPRMDQPVSTKRVLQYFVDNFEAALAYTGMNHPELFDFLAEVLKKEGLVQNELISWDHFSDKLCGAAEKAGLLVVRNEVVAKKAEVPRQSLPAPLKDQVISVSRRFGVTSMDIEESGKKPRNQRVVVRSNILIHAFQRT